MMRGRPDPDGLFFFSMLLRRLVLMLALAAGSTGEPELQAWLDQHCVPMVVP